MPNHVYFDDLPEPRKNRKVRYDWHAYAKVCRGEPGKWVKVSSFANRHAISTVSRKQSSALLAPDGVFQASIRNGRGRFGELWMRFAPYSDEDFMARQENRE